MTNSKLIEIYDRRFTSSAAIAGLATIAMFGIFMALTQPVQTDAAHQAPGVELPLSR